MFYIELGKLNYRAIPISYEADGLLLVADMNKDQADKMLEEVNKNISFQGEKFLGEEFLFEFKKTTFNDLNKET